MLHLFIRIIYNGTSKEKAPHSLRSFITFLLLWLCIFSTYIYLLLSSASPSLLEGSIFKNFTSVSSSISAYKIEKLVLLANRDHKYKKRKEKKADLPWMPGWISTASSIFSVVGSAFMSFWQVLELMHGSSVQ